MKCSGNLTFISILLLGLLSSSCKLELKVGQSNSKVSATPTPTGSPAWAPPLSAGIYRITAAPFFAAELNSDTINTKISNDGYWVVFSTLATNWTAADTNGGMDVLAVNLDTQQVVQVNSTSAGMASSGTANMPPSMGKRFFSPDNKSVLFQAQATDLVASTTTNQACYIKNLETGAVTLVSSNAAGVQSVGSALCGAFSPDGTKVYFSDTGNLDAGDTNGIFDVYVKDLGTGAVTRLSTDSTGTQLNSGAGGGSQFLDITDDERYLLFTSGASNAVAGDTNTQGDIFRKDLQTGTVVIVSVATGGGLGNGWAGLGSFYDGADPDNVVFESQGTNLVAGDTNSVRDVFFRDISGDTTDLVSKTQASVISNNNNVANSDPILTFPASGLVLFSSSATNYIAGDPGVQSNIFFKNLSTGEVTQLDERDVGGFPNTSGGSDYAGVSTNGKVFVYRSSASNIVSGDTNAAADVFVRVYP